MKSDTFSLSYSSTKPLIKFMRKTSQLFESFSRSRSLEKWIKWFDLPWVDKMSDDLKNGDFALIIQLERWLTLSSIPLHFSDYQILLHLVQLHSLLVWLTLVIIWWFLYRIGQKALNLINYIGTLLLPFNNLKKTILSLAETVEKKSFPGHLPFEAKLLELLPQFWFLSWMGLVSSFVLACCPPSLYHLIVMAPYFNYCSLPHHSTIYWYGLPPHFHPL